MILCRFAYTINYLNKSGSVSKRCIFCALRHKFFTSGFRNSTSHRKTSKSWLWTMTTKRYRQQRQRPWNLPSTVISSSWRRQTQYCRFMKTRSVWGLVGSFAIGRISTKGAPIKLLLTDECQVLVYRDSTGIGHDCIGEQKFYDGWFGAVMNIDI